MAEDILNKIYSERGYIEDCHRVLLKEDPNFLELYLKIWENVFKNGNLDKKTAALVRLAAISVLKIENGLNHGIDQALASGCTEGEIMDVFKIAYLFSGNATLIPSMEMVKKKFHIEG